MKSIEVQLGDLIRRAPVRRAGKSIFPILSMTMHHGLVDQGDKFKKRVASLDTSQYRIVSKNQLVVGFPIDEGVLSIQRLYNEAIVSPAYAVWDLIDTASTFPPYLERFLRSPRALNFYASRLRGTTARRRTLPDDIFLTLPVPLPTASEQRRVAEILDYADTLRAKRRESLGQLESLTQSIFFEMFGDPIVNPHKYPQGPLAELVDPARPITYGILKPGPDQDTGINYVRVADMTDGGINLNGIRKTSYAISYAYRRSILSTGDLLISIRGHVGRLAVIPLELDGANITQDTARLAIKEADPIFVRDCLLTSASKQWMARHTKGVAVKGINLGDLKKLPVIVPPSEAQKQFRERAAQVDSLRFQQRRALSQLDALFSSLQHRAFRGEL